MRFLTNHAFVGDAVVPFAFTPAANCKGPWAKVVLDWDTSVSGTQYDRTAEVWMNGVEIFRGTTSEPPGGQITYHVEKDVTEYANLFTSPGSVTTELANYTDSSNNGIYVVNATLTFYQATSQYPAQRVPDAILPIARPGGISSFGLQSDTDQASANVTLPRNTERAFLEIYAMGQSNDEFWSFNIPDAYTGDAVISSGGTAFREVAVSIDGRPAGFAWPFHYIFTGGLDPDGWIPITAIDTHNIAPMLVDITPFVGLLVDGAPHTVSMHVLNDRNWWMVDGDVQAYVDAGSTQTTGALMENTITPIATQSTQVPVAQTGLVDATTTAFRVGDASGYVDTSHGRVTTTVSYDDNFQSQVQSSAAMNITQDSQLAVTTTVSDANGQSVQKVAEDYPLSIAWTPLTSVKISQGQSRKVSLYQNGTQTFYSELNRTVTLLDGGVLVGASAPETDSRYQFQDWTGRCYSRHLAATAQMLTTDQTTCNSL